MYRTTCRVRMTVIRAWRHKPEPAPPRPEDHKRLMIAGAPVISYNPASGVGIGAAGNVAFYRGHPDHTRISSLVGSLIGTTKEQDGSTGVYLAVQEAF